MATDTDAFVQKLQSVLSFLQEHGFNEGAAAILAQLDKGTDEAAQSAPDYAIEDHEACPVDEYRSASADPVLQGR